MANKIWYAVLMDREDSDWGFGSYDYNEAAAKARNMRETCPAAYIAVIDEGDDPTCIDEITEF